MVNLIIYWKKDLPEKLLERKSGNEYFHANNNARMLIYNKFNFFPNFNLRHGIKVLDKKH